MHEPVARCGSHPHSVDSRTSVKLPREEKVVSAGFPLPLRLEGTDPEEVRLAMQLSQRSVGHRFEHPGSGSDGRRLRLDVRIPAVASCSSPSGC